MRSIRLVGPSPKHQWEVYSQNIDRCKRCGSMFHRVADGAHGAYYCSPTPEWLRAHPDDDLEQR